MFGFFDGTNERLRFMRKHAPGLACCDSDRNGKAWLVDTGRTIFDGDGATIHECRACGREVPVADAHGAGRCNMKYADEG